MHRLVTEDWQPPLPARRCGAVSSLCQTKGAETVPGGRYRPGQHQRNPYAPRVSRISRRRRGLPYLTHTPKVDALSRSLRSRDPLPCSESMICVDGQHTRRVFGALGSNPAPLRRGPLAVLHVPGVFRAWHGSPVPLWSHSVAQRRRTRRVLSRFMMVVVVPVGMFHSSASCSTQLWRASLSTTWAARCQTNRTMSARLTSSTAAKT